MTVDMLATIPVWYSYDIGDKSLIISFIWLRNHFGSLFLGFYCLLRHYLLQSDTAKNQLLRVEGMPVDENMLMVMTAPVCKCQNVAVCGFLNVHR